MAPWYLNKEDPMRRRSMSRKSSKRNFRKGARINGKNTGRRPMRGGYRL